MSNDHDINSTSISVSVAIGDIKVQFNGSAESVLRSAIAFISKQVPTLDLAKRISLNYSSTELIESSAAFIKITAEGPRIILDSRETGIKKISDKQMVALQLVASRIVKESRKDRNRWNESIPDSICHHAESKICKLAFI